MQRLDPPAQHDLFLRSHAAGVNQEWTQLLYYFYVNRKYNLNTEIFKTRFNQVQLVENSQFSVHEDLQWKFLTQD